jgi:hypothetical protein
MLTFDGRLPNFWPAPYGITEGCAFDLRAVRVAPGGGLLWSNAHEASFSLSDNLVGLVFNQARDNVNEARAALRHLSRHAQWRPDPRRPPK